MRTDILEYSPQINIQKINIQKINIQKINIQKMPLDGFKYNTNNYPKDAISSVKHIQESLNQDYKECLDKTRLSNYAHLKNYYTIELSDKELDILRKYNTLCSRFGILLNIEEDYDKLENLHILSKIIESKYSIFNGEKWFFRTSHSSPKDGIPEFPITNAFDAMSKLVTSRRMTNILNSNSKLILYFEKFNEAWNPDNEFRVFVYKNRITAISSYTDNITHFGNWSNYQLTNLVKNICKFHASIAISLLETDSYTMDIHIDTSDDRLLHKIELIEFNSFGYWLAAGSCLFEWIVDFNILYNEENEIVLRLLSF